MDKLALSVVVLAALAISGCGKQEQQVNAVSKSEQHANLVRIVGEQNANNIPKALECEKAVVLKKLPYKQQNAEIALCQKKYPVQ